MKFCLPVCFILYFFSIQITEQGPTQHGTYGVGKKIEPVSAPSDEDIILKNFGGQAVNCRNNDGRHAKLITFPAVKILFTGAEKDKKCQNAENEQVHHFVGLKPVPKGGYLREIAPRKSGQQQNESRPQQGRPLFFQPGHCHYDSIKAL